MALIHERLYKSESLSRIKAQEYIKNLTDYLEATYDSRAGNIKLTTNVQNILLNLDTAIPCGLIINELVSNSMKYAFPGEQVGTIEVSLLVSSADSISLSVKDDGIGIPTDITIENSSSLGLQLVHLLAKQIYGTLKTERKNGTRVEIIFPKPAVFEEIIGE
jgi:two-component sensor histidine kinase